LNFFPINYGQNLARKILSSACKNIAKEIEDSENKDL